MGCYAATPRTFSHPTAQVLDIKNHLFLLDCAEGTQTQLRKNKIKFSRIERIFITHLHGDHFYGLIGLISTFMLLGRKDPLHIYGPKGIKEIIILQLRFSGAWSAYDLHFHELDSVQPEVIFEDDSVTVSTLPLKHRIYTNGYLFTEKPGDRKLRLDVIDSYNIDTSQYRNIVRGKDIKLDSGEIVKNELLTFPPAKPMTYAYCTDTIYFEELAELIKDVDVLYHESTFLETESTLATKTMHSTAKQAARIAKLANVKNLILGHYSTRYDSIEHFKNEASEFFENVHLADDDKILEF